MVVWVLMYNLNSSKGIVALCVTGLPHDALPIYAGLDSEGYWDWRQDDISGTIFVVCHIVEIQSLHICMYI